MANLRSWTQIWHSFLRLWILSIVFFDFKIVTLADDNGSGGLLSEGACKNTNYQIYLPSPYQNISSFSMACKPMWHTFELRYIQNAHATTIILSAPFKSGWVGIGFSRNGMMTGSSAMVGWVNKHGHARIRQFYLEGRRRSEVIIDKGELPLSKDVHAAVATNGAEIYLAFRLQPSTPLGKQPILLAFGSRSPQNHHLSKHDDKTALVFDFTSGSKASVSNNLFHMRRNHGIVGIIGWGLILPAGAIIARYFRHKDPLWFYLHSVIQFVGFIFGLATILLGLQLYSKLQAHIPTHRGIGIFVFFLSILQVLAFFLRPNVDSKHRKLWNLYHSWFGRMALFFAALNIVLGIQAAGSGSDWKIGYGFLLAIVIVAVIILEVLAYLKRKKKRSLPQSFQMDPLGEPPFPSTK